MSEVPTPRGIRILIADSSRIHSQVLSEAMSRHQHVADYAAGASELLERVRSGLPDITLIGSNLDHQALRGFEILRELRTAYPEVRVVMLLDSAERDHVIAAFRNGARGVFCREESLEALCKCVESVHRGQIWANTDQLQCVLEAFADAPGPRIIDANGNTILSKREQDVVLCVAEGLSNRDIALELGLSEHTVKNYLFRIFEKLGLSSRVELILYAFSRHASTSAAVDATGSATRSRSPVLSGADRSINSVGDSFGMPDDLLSQMCDLARQFPKDEFAAYQRFLLAEKIAAELLEGCRSARSELVPKLTATQISAATAGARAWLKDSKKKSSRPDPPAQGVGITA